MKRNISILIIFLSMPLLTTAQYVIDFSNPSTYQVNCGSVTPSQWSVSKSTCELNLPPFILASVSNFTVQYTFKINQSGNLTANDLLTVLFKKGAQSPWQTDTILAGNVNNNVRTFSRSVNIVSGDTLFFKVIAYSSASNGFWAIKSGDINISNVTPIYFPLPVELASFSGKWNDDLSCASIEWSTMSETNNSHFVIEKSYDGIDFEPITSVSGAGNSNSIQQYAVEDRNLSAASYYRLVQVDYDGKSQTYGPIYVMPESDTQHQLISNAWFTGDAISLVTGPEFAGNVNIRLYEINGTLISENELMQTSPGSIHQISAVPASSRLLIISASSKEGYSEKRTLFIP